VTVGAGEIVSGDLYVFAGDVIVDGTVEGDLVAAGGRVVVDGTVGGDLLAAGGSVSIGGGVAGDVRVAGGQLRIDGQVAEDVLAGGGEVTLGSAGLVGGDLLVSGGQLAIQGTVQGNVAGSAGTYTRTGSIGGSEDVTVSPPDRAAPAPSTANVVLDALRHYVVVVLFGAIGLWLAPRAMATLERRLRTEPLGAFFWGLLGIAGFIAMLIVVLILMILLAIAFGSLGFDSLVALDVFGGLILLGAICVAFAFVAGFLADAIVGLALGRLVAEEEAEPRWRPFAVLAVGAGVVVLATALPIVGPWIKFLVVILGLGALLAALWARRRPTVAAAFPVAPAAPSV
jgi:cytoskeletal protein CcmA (bactofilin family)